MSGNKKIIIFLKKQQNILWLLYEKIGIYSLGMSDTYEGIPSKGIFIKVYQTQINGGK